MSGHTLSTWCYAADLIEKLHFQPPCASELFSVFCFPHFFFFFLKINAFNLFTSKAWLKINKGSDGSGTQGRQVRVGEQSQGKG